MRLSRYKDRCNIRAENLSIQPRGGKFGRTRTMGLIPHDNKEEVNMKKFIRRISAVALTATMTMSVLMTSASAYISDGSWDINYVNQLPSRPEGSDQVKLDLFSGGYLTYCSNISGANNRSVLVKATGISDYSINSTGFSTVHKTSSHSDTIIFDFYGVGSTTCVASGTVGYNLTANS